MAAGMILDRSQGSANGDPMKTSDPDLSGLKLRRPEADIRPEARFSRPEGSFVSAQRVLFVCTAIGMRATLAVKMFQARRQAEFEAFAAGCTPREVPESVVQNADLLGLHFRSTRADSVVEFHERGEQFDYVIALCDPSTGEECERFLRTIEELYPLGDRLEHWPLPHPGNPALADKTMVERLQAIMALVDDHLDAFLARVESETPAPSPSRTPVETSG